MLDLISVGDSTLDTFVRINDASVQCTLDKHVCKLCLNYADKIPITRLDQKIAGNACNVAVGASRLGLKAGIYSVVGDDDTGKKIVRALKQEHVSQKYVRIDRGQSSNYSVVLNFKGERTILVYHHPREYVLPKFEPCQWIYYTSVANHYAPLERDLLEYVKRTKHPVRLAYNPGTHQLRNGLVKMREVLRRTSVLFLNKEEAQSLVRSTSIKGSLVALKRLGPDIVVITDGDAGAYAHNGHGDWFMPIFPTPVVEKTGAGDSFATGFLAGLMRGQTVGEAMRWGTANSTSVIGQIGPQAGLLTALEMKKMLKHFQRIKTRAI